MSSPAFRAAEAKSNAAKGSGKKLTNDQLLQLYAHYKVATIGANNTARPGMFDMKGQHKWDAWKAVSSLPRSQAEQKYVQLVGQFC